MQETSVHVIGVGETIDTYLLEAVVATGSTSTTFRARDQRLDRPVTLKVLHGEMFAGVPGARERAIVDATLAASLEHPNIVPVYGAGEVGEGLWIASRLTDGDVLADAVLSPRRTADLLERVAAAIDAAHVIGAIHREIRPECIVLDRWGNPLVRDYGVTRTSGRTGLATRMELLDTLRYAAPELILGRPPTPAADIYGLAAVAVRCLTGTHPFADRPISELVALRTQAPPPALVGPGIDATAINAAIATGMALDPARRPKSAAEFAALLRAAVELLPARVAEMQEPFALADGAPAEQPAPANAAPDRPSIPVLPPEPPPAAGAPLGPVPLVAPPAVGAPPAPPAGATRFDRRREYEPEPEPQPQPTPWATIAICATTILALGAGAIGLGSMSAPGPPPPPRTGSFELVPGTVWRPAPAGRAPQLQFGSPVVLASRPPGTALATAGVITSPGSPGNPLAGEPLRSFAREPAPALVRAGRRTMVRYRGTLNEGGAVTVFVLPTTSDALAVACSRPAAEARCAALVATARLGAAQAVAPQPAAGVATRIVDAIRQLETARGVAEAKLNSREEGAAAEAATTLGSDYASAAQALEIDEGDPGTRAQVSRVGRAAFDASLAYQDLASAIDRRDPVVYRVARQAALRADRALARALVRLRRAGYGVRAR
jgi:Protein kinase domain